MKKSDLMRDLVESKTSTQKEFKIPDNFSEDKEFIIQNNKQNESEKESDIIEYIKKKIVKIRN